MFRLLGLLMVAVVLGVGCGSQGGGVSDVDLEFHDFEGSWILDVPVFVALMNEGDPRIANLPEEQRRAVRTMLEKNMGGSLSVHGESMSLLLVTGPQAEARSKMVYTWKVHETNRTGSVWTLALTRSGEDEEKGTLEWLGKNRIRLTLQSEKGGTPVRMELDRG